MVRMSNVRVFRTLQSLGMLHVTLDMVQLQGGGLLVDCRGALII